MFEITVHPTLWDMMPRAAEQGGQLEISIKDLILIGGGFFLILKSTKEIHHSLEGAGEATSTSKSAASFGGVLL